MVANKTLAKIAVYGAVGCISAVMYMRHKIQERVRGADYFKEALKIVRSHPGSLSVYICTSSIITNNLNEFQVQYIYWENR